METMNVQFDELTQMASEQHGSGPNLHGLTSDTLIEESTLWIETSSSRMVRHALQIPSQSEICQRCRYPTLFTRKEGNDLILISQSPKGIFINQSKYALEMLKNYGLDQCDAVDIPMVGQSKLDEVPNKTLVDPTRYRGMVGSLMYLTASRPDLVFSICMCVRYQAKPTEKHLTAVKWVFRYLKGTINMGLWYPKHPGFNLTTFDADHASCQDSRRSTSRSAQFLGEKLVSWSFKKQKTKHITVRYHFIKEQVENEVVELYFFKTDYQLADIFTKALIRERFEFLINRLGMQSITTEELKRLAESDEE
ncbi:hypothetical protein Tco_0085330 [Tanacetum coccineum]